MEVTLNYENRDRIRTVTRSSTFKLSELTENAQRLRSWAAILGVPVAGSPFITLRGTTAQVHLPIGDEYMPHPDTGIRMDAAPAGLTAIASTVHFAEIRAVANALREEFGADGDFVAAPEFHSLDGDFTFGEVRLPLPREKAGMPRFMRFMDLPTDSPSSEAHALPATRHRPGRLAHSVVKRLAGRSR